MSTRHQGAPAPPSAPWSVVLDTSPTYLIFLIVPCYYITRFGCLWALLYTFISFFGTNLLTGGLAHIAVFCLFQYFEEKEYQTESKRNETFGSVIFGKIMILETWSSSQKSREAAARVESAP